MKKVFFIITAALVMMTTPFAAEAQNKFVQFGIKAGLDFTNMTKLSDMEQDGFLKSYTGFNAGVVMKINLPLGFEVQPELLYVQSGVRSQIPAGNVTIDAGTIKTGSLRLPINIQWGIGIAGVVKPYVFVSPYIGCALFSKGDVLNKPFEGDFVNRLQYGVGLGFGLNVWKFQASFKWNWDLNPLFKNESGVTIEGIKDAKLHGGELSLAFIF